jgi:cytoskeletal protein RodZ
LTGITLARSARTPPRGSDDRFEEFLKKQFAVLKDELSVYPLPAKGRVLEFGKPSRAKTLPAWSYGLAAGVLIAAALPIFFQLNQKTAEARQAPPQATAAQSAADIDRPNEGANQQAKPNEQNFEGQESEKEVKQGNPRKFAAASSNKNSDESSKAADASPKLAAAATTRDQHAESTESVRNAVRPDEKKDAMGGANRPMKDRSPALTVNSQAASRFERAAEESDRVADAKGITTGAVADSEAMPAAAPRSIAIDDNLTRAKKKEINVSERQELEKLWKEYERDPQQFNKNAKRRARLTALLDQFKMRSRVARMRVLDKKKTAY